MTCPFGRRGRGVAGFHVPLHARHALVDRPIPDDLPGLPVDGDQPPGVWSGVGRRIDPDLSTSPVLTAGRPLAATAVVT